MKIFFILLCCTFLRGVQHISAAGGFTGEGVLLVGCFGSVAEKGAVSDNRSGHRK